MCVKLIVFNYFGVSFDYYYGWVVYLRDSVYKTKHRCDRVFVIRQLFCCHKESTTWSQLAVAFPSEKPPADDRLVSLPLPLAVCSLGSSNVI